MKSFTNAKYRTGRIGPFSTWLRFSGLPGCGKTTTIDGLMERLMDSPEQKTWRKIILMPESVCSRDLLVKFHQNPEMYAYRLQASALKCYYEALKDVEQSLKDQPHPFLVIEHTSLETIHAFLTAYKRLGFLTRSEHEHLIVELKSIRRQRAIQEKGLRKIWVNFQNLELAEIKKNLIRREMEMQTKRRCLNDTLLREMLVEVENARTLIDECFESHIYWDVLRVPVEYVKGLPPVDAVFKALNYEEKSTEEEEPTVMEVAGERV